MPSILSSNQNEQQAKDPFAIAKDIASQIMSSPNPQEAFNQMVNSNPALKNGMDMINQYGNGNPRTAFMNYMSSAGKQSLGSQIMEGLKKLGIG